MAKCRHCGESAKVVRCLMSAEYSYTGESRWKDCHIDACIAPIVKALQEGGINMTHSCCGHGGDGDIVLADGRELRIRRKAAEEVGHG